MNAVMKPRSWFWIWSERIGDSPTSTPATNAPSTVFTPMACVVSAIRHITIRMAVTTAYSLTNVSLTQRISQNTSLRPTV